MDILTKHDSGLDTGSVEDLVNNMEQEEPKTEEGENTQEDPRIKNAIITEEMQQEEFKRLQTLNFIELNTYKRQVRQQIIDMEDTKNSMNSLRKLQESMKSMNDELSKRSNNMFANQLESANLDDMVNLTIEEMNVFEEHYDENMEKLQELEAAIDKRFQEFENVQKTSSYMNSCILDIITKKLDSLGDIPVKNKQWKTLKVYYMNVKSVYEHRESLAFLEEKIPEYLSYIKRLLNDIKKEKKNGKKKSSIIPGVQAQVQKTFFQVFNHNQMKAVENYLRDVLDTKETDGWNSWIFQYYMYIFYLNQKEKEKGYHKHIEALIMNIIDIATENYDLPGGKEELDAQIIRISKQIMSQIPKL